MTQSPKHSFALTSLQKVAIEEEEGGGRSEMRAERRVTRFNLRTNLTIGGEMFVIVRAWRERDGVHVPVVF